MLSTGLRTQVLQETLPHRPLSEGGGSSRAAPVRVRLDPEPEPVGSGCG